MARFRADMQRVEPAAPPQRIEEEVAKFAANLARAGTQPYPASHASCLKETSGRPAYDCTLVAGDVIRPTWFEACKRAGGAVLTSNVPPNTPLHYDGEFCTKTFRVGE
ncbi:MAG: hypothetical protein HY904_13125 [Deltaproteobacteria bacterium]|nr:hypothetical protein [Deltaproteobacteria bacterium]